MSLLDRLCHHLKDKDCCPDCADEDFMWIHAEADMIEVDDKTGRPVAAHYYPKSDRAKELQKIVRRANAG